MKIIEKETGKVVIEINDEEINILDALRFDVVVEDKDEYNDKRQHG